MYGEDGRTNASILASRMLEKLRHAHAVDHLSLRRDGPPQRNDARMLDLESLTFSVVRSVLTEEFELVVE
jgi:hypothetical protein